MFFPKINVKNDPAGRWHRPDRHFFANGACQVLAFAFLERYPDLGFRARWIKPAAGFTGNHIYVTDGTNAFDYHGLTTEQRLLAIGACEEEIADLLEPGRAAERLLRDREHRRAAHGEPDRNLI